MSLLNEAAKSWKHPLTDELVKVSTIMCGKDNVKFVPFEAVKITRKRANELITSTFKNRKDFYKRLSATTPNFKGCVGSYSGLKYELVKIPFRYIEEFMMVLGIMYNTIRKGSYPILKSELSGVSDSLKANIHLTPKLRAFFFKGIENFDQKYLTKFSYEMYKLPSKDINAFIVAVYMSLEKSRVISNLFALSYEYLMVERRDDIVLNTCYKEKSRYKFKFDSFYWSRDVFDKVIKIKTPSPKK